MSDDCQRWLPFLRPWERPTIPDSEIVERVMRIGPHLSGLRMKRSVVIAALTNPERHWRPVVVVRGGKQRLAYAPTRELGKAQLRIAWFLERRHLTATEGVPRTVATAWNRGTSIIRNARCHRGNQSSWTIDLADAFESIKRRHLERYLLRRLRVVEEEKDPTPGDGFDLWLDRFYRATRDHVWVYSRLLTFRGRLRRGAPSSPIIFNLLMDRFDLAVLEALKANPRPPWNPDPVFGPKENWYSGIVYTRYGDDLCFSAPDNVFPEKVKRQVRVLVAEQHLRLNPRKERESGGGVLDLPGVVVVRDSIRPRTDYVRRTLAVCATDTMSPQVKNGHRGFLQQFPRRGRTRLARELLRSITPPV